MIWTVRRTFWNLLSAAKFVANRSRRATVPERDRRLVVPIPLSERYRDIPISDIPVANHVPPDERVRFSLRFCKFQAVLFRRFPPTQGQLPQIDPDPRRAVARAYTRIHRLTRHPAPELPPEYEADPIDLGHLAVASPYACYLKACEGGYEWDFRFLSGYKQHSGLRSLACRVLFEPDEGGRRLSAVEIDCELGRSRPEDPTWRSAQRIALGAATNHLSLVRHFDWIHLVAVSNLAMATRNELPFDHPVRRLLWPHVWGTQYSNELVTEILLMKGGDFESVFSFTQSGLCALLEDSYKQYDFRVVHPTEDATRRGIVNRGLDLPYLQNRQDHYDVFYKHTTRYLSAYYESDVHLADDRYVVAWIEDLSRRIPNGFQHLGGLVDDKVTIDGVAHLVAGLIYLGSVEHEVLGTALWNYQVWTHVQPTRIYRSGRRESIDVYQRLVNYNHILNVRRSPLCSDFTHLALDAQGRAAFRAFLVDLQALQKKLGKAKAHWEVSPKILESGVNG